LTNAKLAG